MLLALAPQGVDAEPLIVGCCDSLSAAPGGYLDELTAYYPNVEDIAVPSTRSWGGLLALETELAVSDPDAAVILSGTPDAFVGGDWLPHEKWVEEETVANIEAMVTATLEDLAEPVFVAPPPVYPPCAGSNDPTCAEIGARIADLAVALDDLSYQGFNDEVPFIDLWTLFSAHPEYYTGTDGVHPNATGDLAIADEVALELDAIFDAPPDCSDGVDNDDDGAIDFGEDFGCDSADDLSERSDPGVIACDDGIDNDGDGRRDFTLDAGNGDPGCGHPLQALESPACNDGIDNDVDGKIDFDGGASLDLDGDGFIDPEFNPAEPAITLPDPQCGTASGMKEGSNGECGLGFELALVLPPLLWWRRRRGGA